MQVRILKAHDNAFGKKYRKAIGDVYEHPSPQADITFGYVEKFDGKAKPKTRARRQKPPVAEVTEAQTNTPNPPAE